MIERVYVTQYEGWWSFTLPQWQEFVAVAIEAEKNDRGWCLPDARRVQHQPRDVRRPDGFGYISLLGRRIVRPLDWDLETWEAEARWRNVEPLTNA